MKKKLIAVSGLVLGFAPIVAFAQAVGTGVYNSCRGVSIGTIEGIICKIGDLLNLVVPVLIALGVVYFVWGVISYVLAGDEEAKSAGRDRIIYGIIGLAVIIALWGLVRLLTNTFGIDTRTQNINLPTVSY